MSPAEDAVLRAELARGWDRWGEGVRARQEAARAELVAAVTGLPLDEPGPYDGRRGAARADVRRLRKEVA